jgi:hypothetical protein
MEINKKIKRHRFPHREPLELFHEMLTEMIARQGGILDQIMRNLGNG